MAVPLSSRLRGASTIIGYVAFALFVFVMSLQLTFPYDRVKDKLIETLAPSYDVTVGSVEHGIMPGKMILKNVTLRSRPTKADEVASVTVLDRVDVKVGIFALLRGAASIDLKIAIGSGVLDGNISVGKTETKIDLTATGIAATRLGPLQDALGLPILGKLNMHVGLDIPPADVRKVTGQISFSCVGGCVLGDGKATFKPPMPQNPRNGGMMKDGISEFGPVTIDKLNAVVDIKNGSAEITKWEFASLDGDLQLAMKLRLGKTLRESDTDGCIRYASSPALLKKNAKTGNAITLMGGAMDPQGLFDIKLSGRFSDQMIRRPTVCSNAATDGTDSKKPFRPALTTSGAQPGTPPRVGPGGGTTPDDVFAKSKEPPQPPPGVTPSMVPGGMIGAPGRPANTQPDAAPAEAPAIPEVAPEPGSTVDPPAPAPEGAPVPEGTEVPAGQNVGPAT